MYNFNPDVMQLDDGATGAPRVARPRTDTTQMTGAEAEAASMQAGRDLGLTEAQLQEGITDASQLTKLPGETNTQFNARVCRSSCPQARAGRHQPPQLRHWRALD